MQKTATKVFIYASIAFGIIGILVVLTSPLRGQSSDFNALLGKLLLIDAFIILPSFALSVAGKYLNSKH
jgi:Na+/H+ antiporter NhaA